MEEGEETEAEKGNKPEQLLPDGDDAEATGEAAAEREPPDSLEVVSCELFRHFRNIANKSADENFSPLLTPY